MREIKFRAWDKVNEIMCEVEGITFDENGDITFLDTWDKEHGYQEAQEIKYFELLRYTGLKDKNGKEIYEGDIVDYWNPNGDYVGKEIIEYKKGTGYEIRTPFVEEYDLTTMGWAIKDGYKFEIIGNKYEDGDMLESKRQTL